MFVWKKNSPHCTFFKGCFSLIYKMILMEALGNVANTYFDVFGNERNLLKWNSFQLSLIHVIDAVISNLLLTTAQKKNRDHEIAIFSNYCCPREKNILNLVWTGFEKLSPDYRWAVNRTMVNFDWNVVGAVNWMTEKWVVKEQVSSL